MGLGCRSAVVAGSKGVDPGVAKALRCWLIVSSMAVRETRRKSMVELGYELLAWEKRHGGKWPYL